MVFGITYAFTSLAHTVDVYADTSPGNSLHHVAADTVLHSITKRPVVDMAQLNNASQSYDLIVYADWYPRDCWGPEDTSLRGARAPAHVLPRLPACIAFILLYM